MPSQIVVDNKFIAGLKTDVTGLTFPENACIDTDNITFDLIGNVTRRLGIDFEENFVNTTVDRANKAISSFIWTNVGGDGNVKILVEQIGSTIYFYRSSSATVLSPLSNQILFTTIDLTIYLAAGSTSIDVTSECQYAAGYGYLFIFHKNIDPLVITYNSTSGTLTTTLIKIFIRDFDGIIEPGVADTFRDTSITDAHHYNLQNQGWSPYTAMSGGSATSSWSATSTTGNSTTTGLKTWTVQSGLAISTGQTVNVTTSYRNAPINLIGTVVSYASTTLILNITSTSFSFPVSNFTPWTFSSIGSTTAGTISTGYIFDWFTAIANYPSNSDVWWNFKNSSGAFDPATTINKVTVNAGPAPKGFYILEAFNQQRSFSGIPNLPDVTTGGIRPNTGTFFAGRVWYAGVNSGIFNENIYFSQIIENATQFGKCHQLNDPTSETLFDLLPTDGGIITIQGSGTIFKLFPIQNGLLVFAGNGIWFITGSQGIGFAANDYVITKVSAIQSISSTSFVDIQGYPMFWNEEGIYTVTAGKGGLTVNSLTVGNIGSFYAAIPLTSKKYVRGAYNPIDYVVQWVYRDTEADATGTQYEFDKFLNFNTASNSFYDWTISGMPKIHGVLYVVGPGGSTSPSPMFKYITSYPAATLADGTPTSWFMTFSDERNTDYVDWHSNADVDYTSSFTTGYKVPGQAMMFAQIPYVSVFGRGDNNSQFILQSCWDFTTSGDTGRWSGRQHFFFGANPNKTYAIKKVRMRGRGKALQLKFTALPGKPMSLIGWSILLNTAEVF